MKPRDYIKLDFKKLVVLKIPRSVKNASPGPRLHSDSEPGVDIVGIHVENDANQNRDFFIWILFDHMQRCDKGSFPLLCEDHLISETCYLEESASHHYRTPEIL